MKTLLAALVAGAFAFGPAATFAQEKKSEPTKEQLKKAEVKKAAQAEATKDEGKKKVKKGGC